SSKIAVIMLDIHHLRDAATLGGQRREDSPAPPLALAFGQLIGLVTRQQCPDNPSILVRHRYGRAVFATALDQLTYPLAPSVRFAVHPAHGRPRSMDEEFAQIAIAPFTNTQQALLPSCRILAWHQPSPGGTLPTVCARAGIADSSHQGRRRERAKTWNR